MGRRGQERPVEKEGWKERGKGRKVGRKINEGERIDGKQRTKQKEQWKGGMLWENEERQGRGDGKAGEENIWDGVNQLTRYAVHHYFYL